MDVFDLAILASMVVLAVLFASFAVVEWRAAREARGDKRVDAQVIQHPRSDRTVNRAA
jgi:hypothetical protein